MAGSQGFLPPVSMIVPLWGPTGEELAIFKPGWKNQRFPRTCGDTYYCGETLRDDDPTIGDAGFEQTYSKSHLYHCASNSPQCTFFDIG